MDEIETLADALVRLTFVKKGEFVKKRKHEPTYIAVNGDQVILSSGKYMWNTPGHAKAAFDNHVQNFLHQRRKYNNRKEVIKSLVERGIVQFVPVGQYPKDVRSFLVKQDFDS